MEKSVAELKQMTTSYYQKYQKFTPAIAFSSGFIYDLITLKRIDDWFTLIQQVVFLTTVCTLLGFLTVRPEISNFRFKWQEKIWGHRISIVHFMFGSLLSAYTIFYFKSASFWGSFIFLGLLTGLLVVNELKLFQNLEQKFKWALFSLCLISFFSYMFPMILGFVGWIPFILSIIFGNCGNYLVSHIARKKGAPKKIWFGDILIPSIIVSVTFVTLYAFSLIPPVPLSIRYMGIYHNVEKSEKGYKLYHQRPFWKFWHNGDQSFIAASGDRIYCYFRIFSPTAFKDKIFMHWQIKDRRNQWISADRIPIQIRGGRAEGFRGFGFKSNYTPGEYRVLIETGDQREVGRISFEVESVNSDELREFKVELD